MAKRNRPDDIDEVDDIDPEPWGMDLRDETRENDIYKDSKSDDIDQERAEFGGGKFRGHGASGYWDEKPSVGRDWWKDKNDPDAGYAMEMPEMKLEISDKVKNKVRAIKSKPADDTETSKPITAGIDKIFAAYRSKNKKLEAIRGPKGEPSGESKRLSLEELVNIIPRDKKNRRVEGMEYKPEEKYDPNPDYAMIDRGAATAAGVKWDSAPFDMRARSNEQREKSRKDAFDSKYRAAETLDKMDHESDESQLQRDHYAQRDALARNHDLVRDDARHGHERGMHDDRMSRDDQRMKLQHQETMERIAASREQRSGVQQDRKDKQFNDLKWKLGVHIDKNQSGALQALGTISELKNLPPSDVGLIKGGFPGWLKSEAGRQVEQKAQFLYNQYTKSMFGTALSEHERQRADRALGNIRSAGTVDQYRRGIEELERITKDRLTTVYAGAGPEVVNSFLDDYSSMYGSRNPNPTSSPQPQAPQESFIRPGEEEEYEAYKRQMMGGNY